MRLLKFRAYHSHLKKMVTTDDYIRDGQAFQYFWYDVACGRLETPSVCEWLGIQDCDSNDVYENDVCEIADDYHLIPNYYKGRKFVIEFVSDELFGIGFIGKFLDKPDAFIRRDLFNLKFRVIGNKFENKELGELLWKIM